MTKHNNNTLMREEGVMFDDFASTLPLHPTLLLCACVWHWKKMQTLKRPAHGHKSAGTWGHFSFQPLEGREDTPLSSLSKDCCSKIKRQHEMKSNASSNRKKIQQI